MKKITVLLMLILVMAIVSACNRDATSEVGGTTTPDVPVPVQEEPGDEPEPAETYVPEYRRPRDLDRTIRVACWWTYMPETGSEPPDPATAARHNELNASILANRR